MSVNRYTREELAAMEIGRTRVSRRLACVLTATFLLLIFTVPVVQTLIVGRQIELSPVVQFHKSFRGVFENISHKHVVEKVDSINAGILQAIDEVEENVEETTFLHKVFHPLKIGMLRLGKGNENVYPGEGRWLFFSKDIEHVLVPEKNVGDDPVHAIVDFRDKLQQRGIELLLIPTPVKPMIHPEKFSGLASGVGAPLYAEGWNHFEQRLREKGVSFVDPAPLLAEYSQQGQKATYLRTDTHWTPTAMELVAQHVAFYVRENLSLEFERTDYQLGKEELVGLGDTANMLKISAETIGEMEEQVTIHPVFTAGGELWRQSSTAPVLLLGDSFSNIYSQSSMQWGRGAGLGEQLSYYLRSPVDTIVQNDQGSYVTREKLSRDLARGLDRLNSTKLVIWQFTVRELNQGEWKIIDLPMSRRETGQEFYLVPEGEVRRVRGEILDISKSPRPGSVPYRDNIVTLHLVNVEDFESGEPLGESLVYTFGMKDNQLTPTATARRGEEIVLDLEDWAAVENEYSAIRRSVLDDEMIEYEMPNWGEPVK